MSDRETRKGVPAFASKRWPMAIEHDVRNNPRRAVEAVQAKPDSLGCPVFFPCGTIRKNISRCCVNERMDIVFFVDARDWEGPPHVSECEGDVGWVV